MTEAEMWQELDRLSLLKADGMLDAIRVYEKAIKSITGSFARSGMSRRIL